VNKMKRWPGYVLIGFFAVVAIACAYQLYVGLLFDMVFAGPKRRARWTTRDEAPTLFLHGMIVYAASLLFSFFAVGVLARGLFRILRTTDGSGRRGADLPNARGGSPPFS